MTLLQFFRGCNLEVDNVYVYSKEDTLIGSMYTLEHLDSKSQRIVDNAKIDYITIEASNSRGGILGVYLNCSDMDIEIVRMDKNSNPKKWRLV